MWWRLGEHDTKISLLLITYYHKIPYCEQKSTHCFSSRGVNKSLRNTKFGEGTYYYLPLAPCLKRLSKLSQLRFFKYACRHFPNYTRTTAKFLLTSSQQWAWRADPQLDRVMTKCSDRHNTGQWLVDQRGIMGFILENCRCHYTL